MAGQVVSNNATMVVAEVGETYFLEIVKESLTGNSLDQFWMEFEELVVQSSFLEHSPDDTAAIVIVAAAVDWMFAIAGSVGHFEKILSYRRKEHWDLGIVCFRHPVLEINSPSYLVDGWMRNQRVFCAEETCWNRELRT